MKYLKKAGGILLLVTIFLGFKLYNKSSEKDDLKDQLFSLCEGSDECKSAVEQYFGSCFEGAYSLGGKRRSGQLDSNKFLACFNERSGVEFFAMNEAN